MVVLLLDELREDTALRLDAERQRRHVEQEDVLHLAAHDARLDGGADGDHLVRVDALVRLLAEQLGDPLLHGRHAGHAADEDDMLDGRGVDAGVGEHLLRRADDALEEVPGQLEQFRARELHVEVLRALGDERQVDLRRHRRGELDLRLLRGVVEPLERDGVLREIGAVVLLELGHEPVDDGLVEVVAAEVVVAGRRLHVERPVAELED